MASQKPPTETYMISFWHIAFATETNKSLYQALWKSLSQEHKLCPSQDQLFSWMDFYDMSKVKVVIVGKEPYANPFQAHSLAFSVADGTMTSSITNINAALQNNGYGPLSYSNLTGWAMQGVLLLNDILSVRAGEPGSHANLKWATFTDFVLSWISYNASGVVFMLWGEEAKRKSAIIKNQANHKILFGCDPAAPAAKGQQYPQFHYCTHFKEANEYLGSLKSVRWSI